MSRSSAKIRVFYVHGFPIIAVKSLFLIFNFYLATLTSILSAIKRAYCVVLIENVADDFRSAEHFILRIILLLVVDAALRQNPVLVINVPHGLHLFMMIPLRSFAVVMMMMLGTLRMAIMLLGVFYDVLKPEGILLDLRRVLLCVMLHLLAHAAVSAVLCLAVNELQVICREVLRQVQLCRFEGNERLFGG